MATMATDSPSDPAQRFLQERIAELRDNVNTAEMELKQSMLVLENARDANTYAEHTYNRLRRALEAMTGEDEMVKAMPSTEVYDNSPRRGGY